MTAFAFSSCELATGERYIAEDSRESSAIYEEPIKPETDPMGTVAQDLLESMQFMVNHMEGNAEGKTHVVDVVAVSDGTLGKVGSLEPAEHCTAGGE